MQLSPYLNFNGNAEEALNFYKAALGGEIVGLMRFGDSPMPVTEETKNLVMNATFTFGNGSMFMVSDGQPGYEVATGNNIHMSIGTDDLDATSRCFNNLAEGGTVTMPLADQFWGARFGMLTDKFGINWMFNCELPKEV